jgi:glycosyltransferase involved in cell wall biosynthesis
MKIAHLSDSEVPSRSANSIQVMKMCDAFVDLGHEVTLFAQQGKININDKYNYYGVLPRFRIITYRGIKGRKLNRLAGGIFMAKALHSEIDAHLIYARETVALVASARLNIPMVFEAHELPEGRLMQVLQQWLFRRPNFRRLVVTTYTLGDSYRKRFHSLRKKQILVASNGSDVLNKEDLKRIASKSKHFSGRLQVGYVGQLYRGKGMEIVIPLAKRFPNIEFWVVGGPEEQKEYWCGLSKNLNNIHFCGYCIPEETKKFREKMDVLLAPTQHLMGIAGGTTTSSEWTSPLKLFEYMSSAKAIIASDLPAIREVIDPGVNALLAPPDDIEIWAQSLSRLESDPRLRQRLGQCAFDTVSEKFSWKRRAEKVLAGLSL